MASLLKRLLSPLFAPPAGPTPLIYAIRCRRCGEVVTVRVFPERDLNATYADDGPTYTLRKEVMDAKCFARMELSAEFDAHRRELSRHISGGEWAEPEKDAASQHAG